VFKWVLFGFGRFCLVLLGCACSGCFGNGGGGGGGLSGLVCFCVYGAKMRVVLDCRGFWWGKIFPNMPKRGIENPVSLFCCIFAKSLKNQYPCQAYPAIFSTG
jgi:hypothetical protein